MSLPGRVDRDGRLLFAPNLRWGKVPIRALIEAAIELPVVVENAANACALAELWFGGHPESHRNLIAVTISEGIGVGLLMNGQLVRGGDAMAGSSVTSRSTRTARGVRAASAAAGSATRRTPRRCRPISLRSPTGRPSGARRRC